MNPDQERKAKEKQLLELETELGLIPRRKLQTLIDVMRGDLKHAVQIATANAYDPSKRSEIHHYYKRHLEGMQKRSQVDW